MSSNRFSMPSLNLPMETCLALWQHTLVMMDTFWLEIAQSSVSTRAFGVAMCLFARVSQITITIYTLLHDENVSSYFIAIDCSSLADPNNGRVQLTGTNVGSTATYFCNEGYVLQETGTRECLSNGVWSGQAPTCERECFR